MLFYTVPQPAQNRARQGGVLFQPHSYAAAGKFYFCLQKRTAIHAEERGLLDFSEAKTERKYPQLFGRRCK